MGQSKHKMFMQNEDIYKCHWNLIGLDYYYNNQL